MSVAAGDALTGGFQDAPIEAARAFRAALDCMARPGSIRRVSGATPPDPLPQAAGTLALILCDHQTPVWLAPPLATAAVTGWLAFHTGAPLVDCRSEAMFAFGGWDALSPIDGFAIGTPEYPDRSATLIVICDELTGSGPVLSGPGIRDTSRLSLPETRAFRHNAALYPLGVDFYFCAGDRLAGLPRAINVEAP